MGRIVKQVSEGTTKYYWYPGDKKEWIRAAVAIGVGAAAAGLVMAIVRNSLPAVVVGTSVTAALAGFNFGRRDSRALSGFPDMNDRTARRAFAGHTGKAVWRAMAQAFGGAAAAVLILNLPHEGIVANWLLPIVPAVVGGLAHQLGMLADRLKTSESTAGPAKAAEEARLAAEKAAAEKSPEPALEAAS